MKSKALVLIAHPDDEVLWGGGSFLRFRDHVDITFVSATGYNDVVRAQEFKNACDFFHRADSGDRSRMLRVRENIAKTGHTALVQEIARLRPEDWPLVITHGMLGELNQSEDHRALHTRTLTHLRDVGYSGTVLTFGIGGMHDIAVQVRESDRAMKLEWLDHYVSQRWYLEFILRNGMQNVETFKIESRGTAPSMLYTAPINPPITE